MQGLDKLECAPKQGRYFFYRIIHCVGRTEEGTENYVYRVKDSAHKLCFYIFKGLVW